LVVPKSMPITLLILCYLLSGCLRSNVYALNSSSNVAGPDFRISARTLVSCAGSRRLGG